MKEKALLSWSGGKDSALALHGIRKNQTCEITALLTTVTEDYGRSSMHGVREVLLEEQARSAGLGLEKVLIAKDTTFEEYGHKMRAVLEKHISRGVSCVIFGDVFLEDLRKYREKNLSKIGMKAVFPIWQRNTEELAHSFINLGFNAITTCVDTKFLDKTFVGREFNGVFLSELPSGVDPCGENGEFHSFVYAGPVFREEVSFKKGETVLRDNRFYYCDLLPAC